MLVKNANIGEWGTPTRAENEFYIQIEVKNISQDNVS